MFFITCTNAKDNAEFKEDFTRNISGHAEIASNNDATTQLSVKLKNVPNTVL